MKPVKQNVELRLRDYMASPDGWGREEGRRVHRALLEVIERLPGRRVFRVSLEGVRRTDASFPRESVVELARRFRGHRGFCLVDVYGRDLVDNWDAAATKRDQPLLCWVGKRWQLLGPRPSRGTQDAFELIMATEKCFASEAAKSLGISLTNASTKLKQLLEAGFVLREELISPSGGVEYLYRRIR